MPIATAKVTNISVSARKARLVAGLIRGRRVEEARSILAFTEKKSAEPILKLLNSACANAEEAAQLRSERVDVDSFVVSEILVDEAMTIHRFHRASRGRATPIRKRHAHVSLEISDEVPAKIGSRASKAAAATQPVKPVAAKTSRETVTAAAEAE